MGVALELEATGKYFPVANRAQVVLDALLRAVADAGVAVRAGVRVIRLERMAVVADRAAAESSPRLAAGDSGHPGESGGGSSGGRFGIGIQHVRDSAAFSPAVSGYAREIWPLIDAQVDEWLDADAVVLATGGLSFPRTGSDGVGYSLVQALGHTLVLPVPALTPLAAHDPLCTSAQGVTVEAELSLWVGGRRSLALRGSLLITHFGYSGPVALDLSRHWLRAEGERRRVTASFLPGESRESLARGLAVAQSTTVRRYFAGRLPERLVEELASEVSVDPSAPIGQLPRALRSALMAAFVERELPITGTLGYEKAEVTAGGVPASEVTSTLESRIVPGLFLCGEVLDVEGRLGGFNFQWAWSSGTVAGRSAGRLVS
jgi:predicted flavoprotein YhiN